MKKEGKYILWLASWYPNKLTPYDGDFIQRHAKAVALFQKLTVIHIKKDEHGVVTGDVKEITTESGNLTEIIVFYHSFKTGIGLLNKIFSVVKYRSTYRALLKKYLGQNGKPDIVHVHVALKAGQQALWLKKKFQIPFIISEHWSVYYPHSPNNIYDGSIIKMRLLKSVLKNSLLILPVVKSLDKAIRNVCKVPSVIIPNVVDTVVFFYKPYVPQTIRFVHPSSMDYFKNPEGIIRAAKMLADEGFKFELILVGCDNPVLIEMAKTSGMLDKSIFFTGVISYLEVAKEMQKSSALLMFSRFESLPCVILEALCCGIPVISSNVGGISEVINEDNGILVASENEAELKEAMKKMILNYSNYNRQMIAENASAKFNYSVVGKQIIDIYEKIKL